MASRAIKNNNKLMNGFTVIARLPSSFEAKTLLRNVIAPWIWGTKAGSIGSIGSVGGGKVVLGIEWSSSSRHDILLSRNGFSAVGEGFKVDGGSSWYMPCNGIPPWLEYECAGNVDVIIYFDVGLAWGV